LKFIALPVASYVVGYRRSYQLILICSRIVSRRASSFANSD
jgi:hypothetical protein